MDNTGYTPEEPIAAIATALSPAALGIVRTSGKGCIELVSKVFSRPKALLQAQGNTIVYGWIVDENKNKVDEVLVSVFKAPHSYTGEDMCDISCHGGVSIVNAVYTLLLKNGFRTAERGEYTFRSYINGKTDLTKAEAVREIIDAKTDVSRSKAVGRLSGNLYATIDSVKKLVVDTLANIEVEIEYPEDEEAIADSFDSSDLVKARDELKSLTDSWKSEKLYQDGARVVLAGKTNAGKSSLFNALLKEDRAIVSDIEGTTRDWLESWVSFDGIPARLFDTAGLRATDDVIEARGVELTKDLSGEADVILYLADATKEFSVEDRDFIECHKNLGIPLILVWNKCDKADAVKSPDNVVKTENCITISAKSGLNIGALATRVKQVVTEGTDTSHSKSGLGSERQKQSVAEALERVEHALEIAHSGEYGLDAVVQDLEDCLDCLGEVTGEVTPDDVLGSIFARFCVGK